MSDPIDLDGHEVMTLSIRDVRTGDWASLLDPDGRLRWMRVIGFFTGIHKQARLWVCDGAEAHCIFLKSWHHRRLRVARRTVASAGMP